MKFEDKLIELRKKNGLSQEQLAEKLNVTRQTISKWELGQSKPDLDKITLMGKIYNVNIDELIDESKKEISKKTKTEKSSNRKFILYIVIVLFILCIAILGYRLLNGREKKNKNVFSLFENINISSNFGVDIFNSEFENHNGEQSSLFLESVLADLISSNSKNTDHQIELIVDEVSYGTEATKIKEFKNSLSSNNKYDLSFEYDTDGYINKMIIDTIEEDISVSSFNNKFEVFAGETYGSLLEDHMADLITYNKKYTKHQIELIFDGTSYGTDVEAITNKKYELDTWTKYDLSFEYDEKGYINKFIVVTR